MNSLRSSEWMLVGSLLIILASLFLIAKVSALRSAPLLEKQSLPAHEFCSVRIEGAVNKPGVYQVLPGTLLKKVLLKSRPKRFADLRPIDLAARVEGSLEIHLEELMEISVRIEGAVQSPLSLIMPAGTKVSDLRSKIALDADADPAVFKSRRLLKDGEVLRVPKKGG